MQKAAAACPACVPESDVNSGPDADLQADADVCCKANLNSLICSGAESAAPTDLIKVLISSW